MNQAKRKTPAATSNGNDGAPLATPAMWN
jgi:hypothetical protein